MINSVSTDINKQGIFLNGTPFGCTYPSFFSASDPYNTSLRIHSRKIFIPALDVVSSVSNPFLTLPVSFGGGVAILWRDEEAFFAGEDFLIQDNKLTWINENISLTSSNSLIIFGPANSYTAKAFTIEIIDMENPSYFNNSLQTIQLEANGRGNDYFPYNQNSIYLTVDRDVKKPGIDYIYSSLDKKITWIGSSPLTTSNKVRIFYYNLFPTTPYRLGESLVRIQKPVSFVGSPPSSFSLVASLNPFLSNASNVFQNSKKKIDGDAYSFAFPSLKWNNTNSPLTSGDHLDISYFRSLLALFGFFNEQKTGPQFSIIGSGTYAGMFRTHITTLPVKKQLGFLYHNGILAIGDYYDAIDNNPGTHIPSNPQFFFDPSDKHSLIWNPNAYLPAININLSDPSVDSFEWRGFSDSLSGNSMRVEYWKGWGGTGSTKTLTSPIVVPEKAIAFYNGVAQFQAFNEFSFDVTNTILSLSVDSPADPDDDIVLWGFTDESYAEFWDFINIQTTLNGSTVSSTLFPPLLAFWGQGESLALTRPIKDPNKTFLFINGVLANKNDYSFDSTGAILTNVGLNTINGPTSGDPDNIMLISF